MNAIPVVRHVRLPVLVASLATLISPILAVEQPTPVTPPASDTLQVSAERDTAPTNFDRATIKHEIEVTPGGLTWVDGADFTRRQVSNLADALRYAPGFWVSSPSGTSGVTLSARGSNLDSKGYDTNGVRMLEDGLPITTADGNNHNRFISPLVARQAIVARGANSLEYGGSTLGGTINFITPTAYDSAPLHGFVGGGSHGSLNAFASASQVFDNGADALVTVEGRTFDGYREQSEERNLGVYANAGYRFTEVISTRLYVSYLDNHQELPGALTQAQVDDDPDQANPWNAIGQHALDVEAYRLANKTSFRFTKSERLDVGLSYEHQEIHHPIVAAGQVPFGLIANGLLIERTSDDGWLTARYAATWASHEVVVGANYGLSRVDEENHQNNGGSAGPLWASADMDASTTELYATDRWHVTDQWLLVVGAKATYSTRDIVHYDDGGDESSHPQENYIGITPRLGAIWQFASSAEVFASASRLFEPPTLFELGDEAGGGNDTLDAMTGTSFELGGRGGADLGHGTRWNWEATVFYALIDDEILSIEEPPGSGNTVSGNVDHTIHAGIELAAGGELPLLGEGTHRLAPRASLAVNHFVFDDHSLYGDNDLPGAPEYVLRGELLYRHASGWFAGPTVDLVGPSYADFANTYDIDEYVLLGLRGGYDAKRWNCFVEVRNLLDEDYVNTSGAATTAAPTDAVLYPGEPLSVYAGVEMRY
jgi:iron complex outermembrane recepter protein